ncbi:MAG: EF-hand domain-containing protein [Silicimonas sp.]|nr:EF-hand domain-containing protein [Silicimonas sp.]NNL34958.1 EF-hand domain-containing protein [Silicimonas sp.]RZV98622.1 MAG: EF-hand domain-containing protein [Paracoccaceae bacterium]
MKLMNIATALAVFAGTAAVAQTMVEDTDGDGAYSMEELMVVYPEITEDVFAVVDTNADGAVDADELAAAEEAGVLSN